MRSLWWLCIAAGLLVAVPSACGDRPVVCADPGPHAAPPPRPDAGTASIDGLVTYAMDAVYLGDMRRDQPSTSRSAWQSFGFDLDGIWTQGCSTRGCKKPGGPSSDGQGGVDNGFGQALLPFLRSEGGEHPSLEMTARIRRGEFTMQLRVRGVDLGTTQQTAASLEAELLHSHRFALDASRRPTFSPDEEWPLRDGAPREPFDEAYVTGGTFVGRATVLTLDLVMPDRTAVAARIHRAIVTMDLHGDTAENGTIAGVLVRDDFVRLLSTAVAWPTCAYGGTEWYDIRADGSTDADASCDAMSIGIGFTARRVASPTHTLPPWPTAAECRAPEMATEDAGEADASMGDAAGDGAAGADGGG